MPLPPVSPKWIHDREHVRLLHNAHADQIESSYLAAQALTGNPDGVVIKDVGPVRTLLARGDRWENRAIFRGDETHEQIDAVLAHFHAHDAHCVIELNIANSYVEPPMSWEVRLLPHLLCRGCSVGGMRCVWVLNRRAARTESSAARTLVRFGPQEIKEYAKIKLMLDPTDVWSANRCTVEGRPGHFHYVGFEGDRPCASGSLFVRSNIGFLAYWETSADFRGRGFQQAGICQRVRDAFAMGCDYAFSVSDYNYASPRNLQRCGFQLAYNYLVVKRAPSPL